MGQMKPILFNTEMVKAILDGRKTVTRRIADINTEITCNDGTTNHDFVMDNFAGGTPTGFVCRKCGFGVAPPHSRVPCGTSLFRPRYWPGDILYVRETWCDPTPDQSGYPILYKADMPMHWDAGDVEFGKEVTLKAEDYKWRPSIHMPKEAARIFLRVTDVRVERLNDINGEQAYMEGVRVDVPPILQTYENNPMALIPKGFEQWSKNQQEDWYQSTARAIYIAQCDLSNALINKFKLVWNSTVTPDTMDTCGWDANPWVWVIKFERNSNEEATP